MLYNNMMIELDLPGRGSLHLGYQGPDSINVLGSGANNAGVLKTAAMGICALSPECTTVESPLVAIFVVPDIIPSLNLLDRSLQIVASERK